MNEPGRIGSRLVDACVGLLLAALALWGAVEIVEAIWRPLAITVVVAGFVIGIGWVVLCRIRRW